MDFEVTRISKDTIKLKLNYVFEVELIDAHINIYINFYNLKYLNREYCEKVQCR